MCAIAGTSLSEPSWRRPQLTTVSPGARASVPSRNDWRLRHTHPDALMRNAVSSAAPRHPPGSVYPPLTPGEYLADNQYEDVRLAVRRPTSGATGEAW